MWRYRNPVDVRFGAGVFDDAGQGAGRPRLLPRHLRRRQRRRRLRRADAPGRRPWPARPPPLVRNIGPNPDFIGLARVLPPLRRRHAAGRGDRGAGRRLGDGRRQGAGRGRTATSTACAASSRPARAATRSAARRSSPSPPPPAPAARSRAGPRCGTPSAMKKYSLARDTLYPETALVDPAADARPAARHHRSAPASMRSATRWRASGTSTPTRCRRAGRDRRPRGDGRAAPAGRRSRQRRAAHRACPAPACSPASPSPTPGPRSPTRCPII